MTELEQKLMTALEMMETTIRHVDDGNWSKQSATWKESAQCCCDYYQRIKFGSGKDKPKTVSPSNEEESFNYRFHSKDLSGEIFSLPTGPGYSYYAKDPFYFLFCINAILAMRHGQFFVGFMPDQFVAPTELASYGKIRKEFEYEVSFRRVSP